MFLTVPTTILELLEIVISNETCNQIRNYHIYNKKKKKKRKTPIQKQAKYEQKTEEPFYTAGNKFRIMKPVLSTESWRTLTSDIVEEQVSLCYTYTSDFISIIL